MKPTQNMIGLADNLEFLPALPSGFFRLIYIDPPFNTGKLQQRLRIQAVADPNGTRIGFGERKYRVEIRDSPAYQDEMAPSLVGEGKAGRGKTPTDGWWLTIVPTNSKEKSRGAQSYAHCW